MKASPREGVDGGFAFARPKPFRGGGLLLLQAWRRLRCAGCWRLCLFRNRVLRFRAHAPPSCLHGGPKPTRRPRGSGKPWTSRSPGGLIPTDKDRERARRSMPLSPAPYVSVEIESASSRTHRHVTRSVRRRKEVQDTGGLGDGENRGVKKGRNGDRRRRDWEAPRHWEAVAHTLRHPRA